MKHTNTEVEKYYKESQVWYDIFWSDKKSLAMHYGFWDSGISKHSEALIEQYRVIAKLLQSREGDTILDAGCGIGGASLWLSQNFPGHYTGVTLSQMQVDRANNEARKRNVFDRVNYVKGDFFKLDFENQSFSKIFCLESACYAYPEPSSLYRELYRVLKPGGILVISDGMLIRHAETNAEKEILEKWFNSWALSGGCTDSEVLKCLQSVGFTSERIALEATTLIKPDVKRLSLLGHVFVIPLKFLSYLFPFFKSGYQNSTAAYNQAKAYKVGLFGYKVVVAEKV